MKISKIIFFIICLISVNVFTQENVTVGKYQKLQSKILGGEVTYLEHLPEGYDKSNKEYPVIFMMNGQDIPTFAHAAATLDYLSNDRIPDIILIGISNTGAAQTSIACPDDSGKIKGADNFYNFLEKELLPEIKKNYRTNDYKILMGQSNMGIFVLHTFVNNPDLFNAYIVSSPMLKWCPDYYLSKTKELFTTNKTLKKKLYVSYGNLDYVEVLSHIDAFEEILKKQSSKEFEWKLDLIENCGHVPQVTLNNALLFFFSECTFTPELKKLNVEEIKTHFQKLSKEYGFTVQPKGGVLFDMVYDLRSEKNYAKAVDISKYLVSLYPNSAMYYYGLGVVQYLNEDKESAKKNLEESLKIDPDFTRAKQLLEKLSK